MPIDLTNEHTFTFAKAARYFPSYRDDRPTHASRVARLAFKGTPAPDGRLVKLEYLKINGQLITSIEAIRRFTDALTPREDSHGDPPQSSASRRRAAERASRELDRIGI